MTDEWKEMPLLVLEECQFHILHQPVIQTGQILS